MVEGERKRTRREWVGGGRRTGAAGRRGVDGVSSGREGEGGRVED